MKKQDLFFQLLQGRIAKSGFADRKLTLGEIVDLAESLGVRMSDIVIAEATREGI